MRVLSVFLIILVALVYNVEVFAQCPFSKTLCRFPSLVEDGGSPQASLENGTHQHFFQQNFTQALMLKQFPK